MCVCVVVFMCSGRCEIKTNLTTSDFLPRCPGTSRPETLSQFNSNNNNNNNSHLHNHNDGTIDTISMKTAARLKPIS